MLRSIPDAAMPLDAAGETRSEDVPDRNRRHAAGADPNKRAQILAGAWDLVMSHGFEKATMAAISRQAGVSKGTLYVYFRDKSDLFVALIEEMRIKQLQGLGHVMMRQEPIEQRLASLGRNIIAVMTSSEMLRLQRRVIAVAERMPDLSLSFYEAGARHPLNCLTKCLIDEHGNGILCIDDPELAAQQFIDLACGLLWRRRLFGSITAAPRPEEISVQVDGAVHLFLAAYSAQPRR